MSASQPRAHDLARGDSLVPSWVKEIGRAVLQSNETEWER